MCRIDDGDRLEPYYQKHNRKARKAHTCSECLRTIAAGEHYFWAQGCMQGGWFTWHICAHCRVACNWLIKQCSGFLFDMVGEEIREHAEEYPALRDDLLALDTGMKAKWQAADGALMPLPAMSPVIDVSEAAH